MGGGKGDNLIDSFWITKVTNPLANVAIYSFCWRFSSLILSVEMKPCVIRQAQRLLELRKSKLTKKFCHRQFRVLYSILRAYLLFYYTVYKFSYNETPCIFSCPPVHSIRGPSVLHTWCHYLNIFQLKSNSNLLAIKSKASTQRANIISFFDSRDGLRRKEETAYSLGYTHVTEWLTCVIWTHARTQVTTPFAVLSHETLSVVSETVTKPWPAETGFHCVHTRRSSCRFCFCHGYIFVWSSRNIKRGNVLCL